SVAEEVLSAGGLQRTPNCVCVVRSPVNGPVWRRVAGIAASRRAGDGIVVLIEDGELVAKRGRHRVRAWKAVILQTQMVAKLRACTVAAALGVGDVAVYVVLAETSDVEIALQRPRVGQRIISVQPEQAQPVLRR